MSLIPATDIIKSYIVVDNSFNTDKLIPFLNAAETEIISILGEAQYEELESYFDSNSSGITELDNLLPIVQRPLVLFAFSKGIDSLNVSIGNNGIAIVNSSNLAPASQSRVESLKISISELAYDALEDLLLFLESNYRDYPLWEASSAFAFQYDLLIPSARLFDTYFKIKRSRQKFLELRPSMFDIETLHIIPQISQEFISLLKEYVSYNDTDEFLTPVIKLLQKALAYMTMGETNKDTALFNRGKHYLMHVKTILDKNPENYPEYMSSSVYDETLTSYQTFENDEDNHLVMF